MRETAWSRLPRKALLLPVIGLAAGLLTSFLVTPRYVSTAVMAFVEVTADSDPAKIHHNVIDFFRECQAEVTSRVSLSELIQNPSVNIYDDERRQLPLEDVIEKFRHELEVTIEDPPGYPRERTVVFRIRLPYRDAQKARMATQHLVTRFIDTAQARTRSPQFSEVSAATLTRMERMEARLAELEKRAGIAAAPVHAPIGVPITAEVVEPASLPERPVFPNRMLFAGVGLAAGLASLIAIAVRRG